MNRTNEDIVSSSHIDSGDLIVEILLRLPPNSVHRFRRVCKQWYSLISNLDFIRTHAITDHQLLVPISKLDPLKGHVYFVHIPPYYDDQYDEQDRKPDPLFVLLELFPTNLLRNYQCIDSSNGLLLFCKNQNLNGAKTATNYYVTNPSTKSYFKLPTMIPIPNIKLEELVLKLLDSPRHTTLVFDPSISLSYKLIRYLKRRYRLDYINLQIYVYSSETRSWRVLNARIPYRMDTYKSRLRSVVLNGVLYWSYWMTEGDDLVCFDVEKELVWFLPLPPRPVARSQISYPIRNCLYFGECGGRLRLIETFLSGYDFNHRCPCIFDVMETDPQQQQQQQQQQQNGLHYTWTVKYHVNLETIYYHGPFVVHCYKTKNRRGGGEEGEEEEEEEVLLLKLKNDRKFFSFRLASNKFKHDEIITIPESIDMCGGNHEDIFTYKPTLFPVS